MTTRRTVSVGNYEKQIVRLLAPDDRTEMESAIALNPLIHPVVAGTGGVRKARWALPGRGKSGGIRVLFFLLLDPDTVYLLRAYAKNGQETLTDADKKEIRKLVQHLRQLH